MKVKEIFASLALVIIVCGSYAQETADTTLAGNSPQVLVGQYTRADLQEGEFGHYFLEEYQAYTPCRETIRALETSIYEYSIVIVLGTWCHDSQQQVPRFYKLLDQLDYETTFVKNICLDKDKKAADLDITALNIEWVPTFIFYNGDEEIGRIIETPESSLEEDTFRIVTK